MLVGFTFIKEPPTRRYNKYLTSHTYTITPTVQGNHGRLTLKLLLVNFKNIGIELYLEKRIQQIISPIDFNSEWDYSYTRSMWQNKPAYIYNYQIIRMC